MAAPISRSFFAGLLALGGVIGCSSTSSLSSPSSASGCDVTFADVQAAGATLAILPFHDDGSNALFWNPKLKHLDLLGGDLADKPARAFELELFTDPIVDGATISLRLPDPANPLAATPRLTLVDGDASKMTSVAGTVHFTTASDSRLVFTVDGAKMVVLDANGKTTPSSPSLTMSMRCAVDARAEP